jgi:hypothetical protein
MMRDLENHPSFGAGKKGAIRPDNIVFRNRPHTQSTEETEMLPPFPPLAPREAFLFRSGLHGAGYSPRTPPALTSSWYGWNSHPGRTGTYSTSGVPCAPASANTGTPWYSAERMSSLTPRTRGRP